MKLVYDKKLFILSSVIILFGLVMLFSASSPVATHLHLANSYFVQKQAIIVVFACIIGFFVSQMPIKIWHDYRIILLFFTIFILCLVFVPGIGHTAGGSSRWIRIMGMGFQASELAKVLIIIYFAGYLTYHENKVSSSFISFIKPFVLIGLVCLLILLSKDLGTTIVVMTTAMGMAYMARAKLHYFTFLFVVNAIGLYLLAISSEYRKARIISFWNPWEDVSGSGYQLVQSLIAIGSGRWFGEGLGSSTQKLLYIPEGHNDFIFAIFAEEFGFIGVLCLVLVYAALIYRMMQISVQAQILGLKFNSYLGFGLSFWFALQVIIHMGVNLGLLPTTGLTLPLISYGGSSILVLILAIALMFRISYENANFVLSDKDTDEHNNFDNNEKSVLKQQQHNLNSQGVISP
jgi:cell division protein FtsW